MFARAAGGRRTFGAPEFAGKHIEEWSWRWQQPWIARVRAGNRSRSLPRRRTSREPPPPARSDKPYSLAKIIYRGFRTTPWLANRHSCAFGGPQNPIGLPAFVCTLEFD